MNNDLIIKVGADITDFSRRMNEASKTIKDFSSANKDTFDSFKKVGAAVTGAGIAIAGGLGLAVKESSDFQSAFAGVRKTVDASPEGFANLEKGIRDMAKELPATAVEIANVAESAGQLGIAEEDILSFTRTMIDLGEATNMSSDEAATSLARFANITGMSMDTISNLGSTIVDLGNNSATTESEIVALGMRIAAAGTQANMTESDIMAISAAASSLGIEAEAGGTALSMLFTKMTNAVDNGGKSLEAYAKTAGMSAKEFSDAWKNDPTTALNSLLEGLDKSSKAGENMSSILDELGVSGIREIDVLKRMASGHDLLSDSLDIANSAWDENSALTDEAAQRYETFESKVAILGNQFKDLGITIGNVLLPFVTDLVERIGGLVEWFSNLNPKILEAGVVFAAIAAAVTLVVGPILLLIGYIPQMIALFTGFMTVIKAVGAAIAFLTSPIGLVVAAVIGLAILIYKYWDEIKEYTIKAWGAISDFFVELWANIVETATTAWTAFSEFFVGLWSSIKEVATTAWNAIVEGIMAVVTPIVEMVTSVFSEMSEGLSQLFDGMNTYFEGVWELIKNVFLGAVLLIVNLVTGDFEELKKNTEAIMDNVKDALTKIWDGIKTMFSGVISAIKGGVKAGWENLKSVTTTVMNAVKSFITVVWNGIKTFFTTTLANIWTTVKQKFTDIKTSISDKMTEAKEKISEIWDGVMTFFREIDLKQIGKDIIQGLINGIKDKVTAVGDAVKEVTSAITGKIKGILNIKSPSRVLMAIGRDTGEGLAIGIAGMRKAVEHSAAELAEAATVKPDLSYATPNASYGSLSAALSGEVNVNQRDSMLIGAIQSLEDKLTNLRVEMDGQKVGSIVRPLVNSGNAVEDVTRYF